MVYQIHNFLSNFSKNVYDTSGKYSVFPYLFTYKSKAQENGLFVRASVFNPDNHGSILSSVQDGQSRISNKEKNVEAFMAKDINIFSIFFSFSFLQKRQSCVKKNKPAFSVTMLGLTILKISSSQKRGGQEGYQPIRLDFVRNRR